MRMAARHEAFMLGLTLRNLESRLVSLEEDDFIDPREARTIRRGIQKGLRRKAALEKKADQEADEELERQVHRFGVLLEKSYDVLSDSELDQMLEQYDNARVMLEGIHLDREQARRRKAGSGPRRGARYLDSVRADGTARKSASGGREQWCRECMAWHHA